MLLSERRAFRMPTPTPNPSEIVRRICLRCLTGSLNGYACAHIMPRCPPDHDLFSSYTTSQTLETSADTANLHRGVQRQNLQYSDIQTFL